MCQSAPHVKARKSTALDKGLTGTMSCADNKQSLEVEFEHLVLWSQKLALAVVDAPKTVLGILDAAAKEAVLEDWPEFSNIHQDIFVRFPTLSVIDSIRNLRWVQEGAYRTCTIYRSV